MIRNGDVSLCLDRASSSGPFGGCAPPPTESAALRSGVMGTNNSHQLDPASSTGTHLCHLAFLTTKQWPERVSVLRQSRGLRAARGQGGICGAEAPSCYKILAKLSVQSYSLAWRPHEASSPGPGSVGLATVKQRKLTLKRNILLDHHRMGWGEVGWGIVQLIATGTVIVTFPWAVAVCRTFEVSVFCMSFVFLVQAFGVYGILVLGISRRAELYPGKIVPPPVR